MKNRYLKDLNELKKKYGITPDKLFDSPADGAILVFSNGNEKLTIEIDLEDDISYVIDTGMLDCGYFEPDEFKDYVLEFYLGLSNNV
jgi:hypothetical protein